MKKLVLPARRADNMVFLANVIEEIPTEADGEGIESAGSGKMVSLAKPLKIDPGLICDSLLTCLPYWSILHNS